MQAIVAARTRQRVVAELAEQDVVARGAVFPQGRFSRTLVTLTATSWT